jgi:hypothetical protein
MHTLNDRIRRGLLAAAAVLALPAGVTRGETFVADLTLTAKAGLHGEYLTASYDFGRPFADIQSVRLLLDVPGGYQGTALTTGNTHYFRSLLINLHDPADPPPTDNLHEYLGTNAFDIAPTHAAEFEFRRLQITFNEQTHFAAWPSFLLTGAGDVSLIDYSVISHNPLLGGESVPAYVSWLPLTGIAGARLIVEATPVPEPAAAVLATVAGAALPRRGRR